MNVYALQGNSRKAPISNPAHKAPLDAVSLSWAPCLRDPRAALEGWVPARSAARALLAWTEPSFLQLEVGDFAWWGMELHRAARTRKGIAESKATLLAQYCTGHVV